MSREIGRLPSDRLAVTMRIRGAAKKLLNSLLSPSGLALASRAVIPSWDRFVAQLAAHQLTPRTVFDIGVAYGTPWLYSAFPRAQYFLIDPTRESLAFMTEWSKRLDAEVLNFALGDAEGTHMVDVRPDIGGASLLKEVGPSRTASRYPVRVSRFDSVIGRFDLPALCKIDVQGYELPVLRGMGERLAEMDVIVLETSLIATVVDGAEIAEVVGMMAASGFALYDIVGVNRRPLDQALSQVDAVFVRHDSLLRRDRRWSNGPE